MVANPYAQDVLRHAMAALLILAAASGSAGCSWRPAPPPSPPEDTCTGADGPRPDTVRRAIAAVPPVAADNPWTETADGHTRDCRLHWVKLSLRDAAPDGPEQLLFFDRDTALGSPTADPKPYTTVVSAGLRTVTVQYQWRVDDDPPCCPSRGATTRYQVADGRLTALDPIPLLAG